VTSFDDADPPLVLASALKHGVPEEEILHAWRHATGIIDRESSEDLPDMTLVLGTTSDGQDLEVGVITWYGMVAIAHAMRPTRHTMNSLRRRKRK
jgi:hypothetical protein